MIIKDEELVLDRILKCAKQFADELIIVDTGSKDKSIEIAKKYTNKVYEFKWCNDFAKARNFSFSKASSDYIMWLDADDYISDENIKKIQKLKTNNMLTDVYMFKYVMGFENNKPTFEFYRERLIKRSLNLQWEGFVHECISPCGKIDYEDIEIEHRKLKVSDPKRNLNLYRKALKREIKFSPREQYYYSRELYYNGFYSSALRELKKYLKLNDNFQPNIIGAYLLICEIYLIKQQSLKAKEYIFNCISKFLPNAEMSCMIGRIFDTLKDSTQAIFWYQTAMFCPKQTSGFVQPDYQNFIPYLELSKLYYYSNNYNEAKKFHILAKKLKPNHPSIKFNEQFFIQ